MDDETTARVFKKDAIIIRQMQTLMQLSNRNVTQAELIHMMFDFVAEYENEFFKEVQSKHVENDRLMEEWTRIMLRRMKEM
jgi:hypothetical protein